MNNYFGFAHFMFNIIISLLCFFAYSIEGSTLTVESLAKYYDYTSSNKHQANKYILKQAGILKARQSFNSLFPARSNDAELLDDILTFIELTQAKLFNRGDKERWETKEFNWLVLSNRQRMMDALSILGFTEAILPRNKEWDAICVLGSTGPSMENRLKYAHKIYYELKNKPKDIILLAGERSAEVGIDGNEEELNKIVAKYNLDGIEELTETHMIIEAANKENFKNIQRHIINTPKGDVTRPTTETTIIELMKWLDNHPEIKRILFISEQPYVKYQEMIITRIIDKQKSDLTYEVIGSKITQEEANISNVVNSFSSYIFAKAPILIKSLNINVYEQNSQDRIKALYGKNKYIYKYLME